ncbi:MAG: hypothetical protein Q8K61_01930 [Gallionella sp.]|jgi:hypothetical protein|nr:hypothetical protein [Gallionellaceae bacterium]MDP1870361.1 hypothetical protein [Gallionella sp.]
MTDTDLELPLLTEVADTSSDDLPILFEIIVDPDEDPKPDLVQEKPAPPRSLNAEEMSHLLLQLETHLETVFAGKLNSRLEELQRLAVDLAVSEFKAELPKLLREALSKPDESSK